MSKIERRGFLTRLSLGVTSLVAFPLRGLTAGRDDNSEEMNTSPILQIAPLGFQWECIDPFLFCAHH